MAKILKSGAGQSLVTMRRGGGLPVIQYWIEKTLAHRLLLWQKLNHHSACKSCAWGTGGQRGGFRNEAGEPLQRCAKGVEAVAGDLQSAVTPGFLERTPLTRLRTLTSQQAERLGRLSHPLILRPGADHYERLGWDEVYAIARASFQKSAERVASYSSGRSSNEAAYILQLMMRAKGSNNLADCSDLCHAASTFGLKQVFGTGTSMVSLEDLKQSDCIVLVGSNAPANHPRLLNELIKLRERGGRVLVVNPVIEAGLVQFASPAFVSSMLFGSEIASMYLQPHPGSDVALFVGMAKALAERGQVNHAFLEAHTEGAQAVLDHVNRTDWAQIVATCGIERESVVQAAQMIAGAERTVFAWAMGVTQQANGVDNIWAIANLALLTGNVGKAGAGTMPIRGHSNVQGFGSMGVTIRLKEEIRQALEKVLGQSLSRVPGYDTRALIEAADAGQVDTLLCLGGNLWGANPDHPQATRALNQIETIFYISTKPNQGHFNGLAAQQTLILPVFTRDENPHRTTTESGNNFVRLNDEGRTHLRGADLISEVELLTHIAHQIHGETPFDWRRLQDAVYVRQLIAKTIPGFEAMADIDRTKEEFTIGGRIFHEPVFPTTTGKASMFVTPLPVHEAPKVSDFAIGPVTKPLPLVLVTVRSYSQHNTVVYKDGDKYRNMPHRRCILLNPDDAIKAGYAEHEQVTVVGNVGQMQAVEIIFGNVKSGTALMFYPEVNDIIRPLVDPRSGTPAYKRVPVLVHAG